MEDRVVEVGVGVGPRARAEQALAAARAQEGHVLDDVREALLVRPLVDGARVDLEVGLEAARRGLVGEDDVAEAVGKLARQQVRVRLERRREVGRVAAVGGVLAGRLFGL